MSRSVYGRKKKADIGEILAVLLIAAAVIIPIILYYGPRLKSGQSDTLSYKAREGVLSVHFIDVGQGDAALITADDGSAMTIDSGSNDSERQLVNYIREQGVKHLKYALFTHCHSDHIGGGDRLINELVTDSIIINGYTGSSSSYDKLISAAAAENIPCVQVSPGDSFTLGSAVITVLGPVRPDYTDDNDGSIVLKITYGSTSALFMGDCGIEAEADLLSLWGSDAFGCDIIKIGHHGSSGSTSEEFISACSPLYAVISCGKNNEYGHPHSSVLKTLESHGVSVLRTDTNGTVIFESDGKVFEPVT